MNVLGINQFPGMLAWTHDSSAALVKDGHLVAAAEEERFNRLRHSRGYPHQAVAYCLTEGNLKKEDIDIIALSYDPYQSILNFPWNLSLRGLAQNPWFFLLHAHQD
jgi:carbamoyltransferase